MILFFIFFLFKEDFFFFFKNRKNFFFFVRNIKVSVLHAQTGDMHDRIVIIGFFFSIIEKYDRFS